MEPGNPPPFVDESGQPFESRLQQALHRARPQFRRQFPALADDTVITETLEEVGRRVRDHERREGPVRNLDAYTWRTARNVGHTRLRRSHMRLIERSLDGEESQVALNGLEAQEGSAAHIEAHIQEQQILRSLNERERALLEFKRLEFSARRIGQELGMSVSLVNVTFFRLKRKLRDLLRPDESGRRSVRRQRSETADGAPETQ